jgi:hypothetical protein
MAMIELKNAAIQVVVDPDHGAEVVRLAGADGINVLSAPDWRSPLPASASRSYGDETLDWLSEYRGGWQELFPNAGPPCEVMGVPLAFHGEVSRARWAWEWIEPGAFARMRTPARLPLVLERDMRIDPDRPVLYLEERVFNDCPFEVPYLWGHHPAFGPPLAEAGARIDLPARRIVADAGLDGPSVDVRPGSESAWPFAVGRDGGSIDLSVVPAPPVQRLLYAADLEGGWFALRNPARGLGVAMAWDLAVFPHLWFWQEIGGSSGMPWYGRAAIAALEPASAWPSQGLAAAHRAGVAHVLEPRQTASTKLTCVLFAATDAPVAGVTTNGEVVLG